MDHGPVPVRTAVQPSLAGQGRPGRNAFSMHFPNESILTEKKRQGKSSFPLALQTVKKLLGGVGGAAAPLTFIRIRRLCRRGGLLILPCKINSLQIRTTSGWPNLLPRKSGENHFRDMRKRQGKSSFPLALLYSIKNYFFTGVGVATELLPFPSPISCCINKKIPTPRSTSPTLAIPGNT